MFFLEKCDERRGLVSKAVILIYPLVQIIMYIFLFEKDICEKGRVIHDIIISCEEKMYEQVTIIR